MDKKAPDELWRPYYRDVCEEALRASRDNKKIVISLSLYKKIVRDYVRALIPSVRFILLDISDKEIVRRNLLRLEKFLEVQKISADDYWKSSGNDTKYGAFSLQSYTAMLKDTIMRGLEPFTTNELASGRCFIINADVQDESVIDKLRDTIGLPVRVEGEKIDANSIAAINYERFKKINTNVTDQSTEVNCGIATSVGRGAILLLAVSVIFSRFFRCK